MKSKGKSAAVLIVLALLAAVLCFTATMGIGSGRKLSMHDIKRGLDLSGGVSIVYQADKENVTDEEIRLATTLIQNRLDRKNWTEAEVSRQGNNRIRVEIPGVADAESAIEELGKTAQLTFMDESGNVLLDGSMIEDAKKEVGSVSSDSGSQPYVALKFNEEGKQKFADATKNNIGKRILIVMDNDVISAPTVNSEITDGEAMITGGFTGDSAQELADLIKEGAMPFDLSVMEMNNIGARLGANAIETSLKSAVVGVALVLLFMLLVYRVGGFAADWALVIYIGLELVALSLFHVTLTLPGIAGIVLSVGMAVDANIVIFERVKEELVLGKSLRNALKAGFKRATPAILDGNVTTLIAAAVLFFLGSGTVKGFATTLMIGIVISMFTALFITRVIVNGLMYAGVQNPKYYGLRMK